MQPWYYITALLIGHGTSEVSPEEEGHLVRVNVKAIAPKRSRLQRFGNQLGLKD